MSGLQRVPTFLQLFPILVSLFVPCASAQDPSFGSVGRTSGGSQGTRLVNGQVVMQGASYGNIRVAVETINRSFNRTIFADGAGSFSISVPVGSVTFLVESEGFQTHREVVDVPPGTGVFMVQFLLRPAIVSKSQSSLDPMVSVTSLNIPPGARKEYKAGLRDLDRGHWVQARGHFEKALTVYPNFPHALHALARMDFVDRQTDQALERLRRAVEIDSKFADGYLALAHILNLTGRYADGFVAAQQLISLRPDSLRGQYELGFASLGLGKDEATLEACSRIAASPSAAIPEVHMLRAGVFLRQGRFAEARDELASFLQEAPLHALAEHARRTLAELENRLAASPTLR